MFLAAGWQQEHHRRRVWGGELVVHSPVWRDLWGASLILKAHSKFLGALCSWGMEASSLPTAVILKVPGRSLSCFSPRSLRATGWFLRGGTWLLSVLTELGRNWRERSRAPSFPSWRQETSTWTQCSRALVSGHSLHLTHFPLASVGISVQSLRGLRIKSFRGRTSSPELEWTQKRPE